MTEPGFMHVAIQLAGQPDTARLIRVAAHFNLSHLKDAGYEFPKVLIREGEFGAWIVGPLRKAA